MGKEFFQKLFEIAQKEEELAAFKKQVFMELANADESSAEHKEEFEQPELIEDEDSSKQIFMKPLGLGGMVAVSYQDSGENKQIFPKIEAAVMYFLGRMVFRKAHQNLKLFLNTNRITGRKEIKRLYRNKAGSGRGNVPVEWVEII